MNQGPLQGDLSQYSMSELFRIDADNQLTTLQEGLLALGSGAEVSQLLEELMRAAHSIKGAARVVNVDAAVEISHAMEDCFVRYQQLERAPQQETIDVLLAGVDLLRAVIFEQQPAPARSLIDQFIRQCTDESVSEGRALTASAGAPANTDPLSGGNEGAARSFRVAIDNLDRLVALAGETRITIHRTEKLNTEADRLLFLQQSLRDKLKDFSAVTFGVPKLQESLANLLQVMDETEQVSHSLRTNLEAYSFSATQVGNNLYTEALACRMRPFSDCVTSLRRTVRTLSRSLDKPCRLEIQGETTEVDRDILEKLESALTHLLRNALDHGQESAMERAYLNKSAEGVIRITASHVSGRLVIRVADDGKGIDHEAVRQQIVQRGLISAGAAHSLSIPEVMEFLFLPGFSMSHEVTEVSGRGVGLDAVRSAARQLRGTVRIFSAIGEGSTFELSTPISQALARCLLIRVGSTPCALPLARIQAVFRVSEADTHTTEGRLHCHWENQLIGLVNAAQVLELDDSLALPDPLPVIVLSEANQYYGVVVHDFLGEEELLLQPLDTELGKVRDLAATALMSDGSPVLVLDDEDFVLSIRSLASDGKLRRFRSEVVAEQTRQKRILVVDDSLTVRELQKKLLSTRGYEVVTAVDGVDGLNTLREGTFDLVITDVDMPRMDGIELVDKIRASVHLRDMPVMIVSYKDRPEDRQRGLEAGADYYLAKSSFHSDELAHIVEDLIGPAKTS